MRGEPGQPWLYDGEKLVGAAHHNASPEFIQFIRDNPQRPSPEGPLRRAAFERQVVHVVDLMADPSFKPQTLHLTEQARTVLAVPLLRENKLIGVVGIWRREVTPFTDAQIALVKTFADQAVIAIENVRLFTELQASNRELSEALEQQTATSEILRVISRSPTDIQPVLDAVAANATRVCGATDAIIMRVEGARHSSRRAFRADSAGAPGSPAHHGWQRGWPRHPRVPRDSHSRRSRTRRRSSLSRNRGDPSGRGWRTTLAVPLVREGVAIGAIVIRRTEVRPFTEKQIQLLETFADQAVIAIENVRLFTELQTRNRALAEALEQQTATAEILRAISSSPTDTQPIFDVIVRNAAKLCDALYGLVFRHDGGLMHLVAHHNLTADQLAEYHRVFPRPVTASPLGRATMTGHVLNIPDVESYPEAPPRAGALAKRGSGASSACPCADRRRWWGKSG